MYPDRHVGARRTIPSHPPSRQELEMVPLVVMERYMGSVARPSNRAESISQCSE